ncbi:MAG: helix-turn-helix transcriptional regulator [Firmicutes bacterium]|nr:helix-turn-helix transcriptional regulator [Bacillota bacterium]
MDVLIKKIEYADGIPVEASLCRIDRSLPHCHPGDLEIVCCIEGELHLVASDQVATLLPGQIHSIDYRDIHYLQADGDNLALIFHLDLQNIPYDWEQIKYVFFACESNHCFAYQRDAMEAVKDMILSFSYGYLTGAYSPDMYAGPVEFFSFYLLQYFNWFNYENQDEYMNEDLYERFHRVLAYCMEHYNEKISISQLARAEHISKNYFSQFIAGTVFKNFSTMIKYIRCYEAEHLLLTTDKPNAEIAYECGFSDPKYFYAAFKQLWGCTPSEHRIKYETYYKDCLVHYQERQAAKAGQSPDEDMFTDDDIPGQKKVKNEIAADLVRKIMADWHLKKTFGEDSPASSEAHPPAIDFALRLDR